jgi:Outer membrane lipoprotein carrier protein LolA-like
MSPFRVRPIAIARMGCVTFLAIAPVQADSANDALNDLMSQLAQRRHGTADFQAEKYISVLKHPVISSGTLLYDAPDHLEQRTLLPHPQRMVLDHGILSMQIGTRSRNVRLADYPQVAPLIDGIRATLAGDRHALELAFELQFTGTVDHWKLELTPRDAHISATLTHIELEGERDAVREVRVQQRDGDHSSMHIIPRE